MNIRLIGAALAAVTVVAAAPSFADSKSKGHMGGHRMHGHMAGYMHGHRKGHMHSHPMLPTGQRMHKPMMMGHGHMMMEHGHAMHGHMTGHPNNKHM